MEEPDCIKRARIASSVGEGWWPIVEKLDSDLKEIDPDYQVDQVKEKFGGLRYYASYNQEVSEQARKLIGQAEVQASKTCEWCGNPGDLGGSRWMKTLCGECLKKYERGYRPWRGDEGTVAPIG
jgi:hypothetical protein